jgi:hypothetical protein
METPVMVVAAPLRVSLADIPRLVDVMDRVAGAATPRPCCAVRSPPSTTRSPERTRLRGELSAFSTPTRHGLHRR